MSKTAFDLRNKKIFAFTPDKIQKIRVQYPAAQFTIERSGNVWKLTEPQKQDIPQRWKVDHVLYGLSTLEYAKIVADSPERWEPLRFRCAPGADHDVAAGWLDPRSPGRRQND